MLNRIKQIPLTKHQLETKKMTTLLIIKSISNLYYEAYTS